MNRMHDPDDRYFLAAFLPEDERRALERAAGDDPRARDMIRASADLRAMLGHADDLRRDLHSEAALAYLAATRLVDSPADPAWSSLLASLETRVLGDPASRARYTALLDRMEALERGSDAEDHFRRISGSDPPRIVSLWPLAAAAAVVACVIGAGLLGRMTEDRYAREAHRSLGREVRHELSFRGEGNGLEPLARRAHDARSVMLGIWPRYDFEMLDSVRQVLGEPGSAPGWLLLGRIHLMMGEREQAGRALELAVALAPGGEAAELLSRLDEDGLRSRR